MFNTRMIREREAFTASTELINLSSGKFIDRLTLSFKGDMTAGAAVTVATCLPLLNPVEIRRKGSTIISIQGDDLLALNAYLLHHNPKTIVAGATTNNQTKVMGLNLPLWQSPLKSGELTFRATRSAVSGVDTETLTVCEISNDKNLKPGYLHYVTLPLTTSAATGFGNILDLPQNGDLQGILFYSETIPTTTAELATMQAVDIKVDGSKIMTRAWDDMKADAPTQSLEVNPGDDTIIDNYGFIDFREDPIPKGKSVSIDINGGVASEAVRIIPIYLCK